MNSIVEALAYYAGKCPEKTAVIAEEEQITYSELWKEVRGFAAYLKSLGLKKGDRVTVKASPSIWFAVSCFGIHLSGCVQVPMEKTIGRSGVDNIAEELSASLVISDIGADEKFRCIDSGKVREFGREYFREDLTFEFPTSDMLCDIMFTTGTTGKSKGVMESHRAVVAVSENVQYGAEIPENNIYLVPAPINHASAIRKMYTTILTGTTVVLLDGFTDIKKFYSYIEKYKVTSILMPPAAVRMILLLSANKLAEFSDQLHHIHTGAAAFPEADKEKLCEILPKTRLYFAYGSSEAGCACMFDYSKYKGLISCVGKPNKNAHVFIVNDEHKEIKSSKTNQGLIAISGAMLMDGYYNEPELTKSVLENGIVYTNDMGYIDDDGFVYMLGRQGDVINIGGLKIAPTEVEDVVVRFPGVAECACFAVADRMGGAVPKLHVVAMKGVKIDFAELRAHMAKYLEAFKIPKLMEQVEELPKTSNGKLDRKRLGK